MHKLLIFFIFISLSGMSLAQESLAIPGAFGFGKHTRGAYAGNQAPTILIVDTLCDANVSTGTNRGSFRWAATRSFPRIIIFEVTGYINLGSTLQVNNPYMTIYGQTAPGEGITITTRPFIINANEVIIQHMKFRHGDGEAGEDAFGLYGGKNAYIDHCSFSWGTDENASTSSVARGNYTFSNCLFSEGLNKHMGFLFYAGDSLTFIRNAFINCAQRQPLINSPSWTRVEVFNNMNYNPYLHNIQFEEGSNNSTANIVGNILKKGPSTGTENNYVMAVRAEVDTATRFYVHGNYSPSCTGGDWSAVTYWTTAIPDSNHWKINSPKFWDSSIPLLELDNVETYLASEVGAFNWNRDPIDQRAIDDMLNGTGKLISSISEVGGFPTIPFEKHELSLPANPHLDDNGNGFTNLEEWVYNLTNLSNSDPCSLFQVSGQVKDSEVSKNTGSITIAVTGGTAPYSYLWNDGITIKDRTGLTAGTYTLKVGDNGECTIEKKFQVNEVAQDCKNLEIATSSVKDENEGNSNGAIYLSVSGGTQPYSYKWNDNSSTQNRESLKAGSYSVVVSDDIGCSVEGTFIVELIASNADNDAPIISLLFEPKVYSGEQKTYSAANSIDPEGNQLKYKWYVPENVSIRSDSTSELNFLVPEVKETVFSTFILEVSDGVNKEFQTIDVAFEPYKPQYKKIDIISIEASSYNATDYPENVLDNNPETVWSSEGIGEWIVLKTVQPIDINYFKIAFYNGIDHTAFFDILFSKDGEDWEPALEDFESCGYSNNIHAFDAPTTKAGNEYNYIKFVGKGNSVDEWNYISELVIYGTDVISSNTQVLPEDIVEVYPNPAKYNVNIDLGEDSFVRIIDMKGVVHYENMLINGKNNITVNFPEGLYIIQIINSKGQKLTKKLMIE